MPPKLKVKPPKDDEGGPPGVPPPNDGPGDVAVNINRRSKMTVRVSPGVPPPNDGSTKEGDTLPSSSARGCFGADVSFAPATSDSAPKQPSPYIDSLSALEQHVCRIAESHLESSFDLSRSTGYLAWKAKNGT
jgi:hypothetical protein